MKKELLKYVLFAVVIVVAPMFFSGSYLMNVLVYVGINTMLALALNLLLGFAGQISLGNAAFFGLGAYISGVLSAAYGYNPWLAMIMATATTSVLAFIFGFPILKLKGHYLAMATLGFGIIVYIAFNETVDLTAGPSGLSGIPNFSIGSFLFDNDIKNYYLIWAFSLTTILLSVNLANSRIGRALRAIHDSETAARVMGVNAGFLKVQIFTLSAFISAVAGCLYAHTMTFISPSSFGFNFSIELLTMVVIGGLGSVYGSFFGAALLTLLPVFLQSLQPVLETLVSKYLPSFLSKLLPDILRAFQDYDIVVYGLILMLMTMFMPGGMVRGIPEIAGALFPAFRSKSEKNA